VIIVPVAPTATVTTLCIPDLRTRRRDSVLVDLVGLARSAGAVRVAPPVVELLRLRERAGTTALGKAVALPHARSLFVCRPLLVLARSTRGIDWCEDGELVHLVMLLLAPAETPADVWHTRLTRVASLARLQKHRQRLFAADDAEVMLAIARDTGAVT